MFVGASPTVPTLATSLSIVLIHRAPAWVCVCSPALESFVVAAEKEVFGSTANRFLPHSLRTDVFEAARQILRNRDLNDVELAGLERNGRGRSHLEKLRAA
ncbi:hypothetical protein SAMN05192544_103638 [Paraburkholderia hospita]|jgi:hypothetical protein|nr:hypothetical protein SAMN05192544_103638 [Paraburkholderia hospita]